MNRIDRFARLPELDLLSPGQRPGMRLHRVEVLNWGTFHESVWSLDANGDNVLLTGDIGSGKSTLVDAITTLLVPAQKISYNKAAGAEARERDLRSYVLGHYKSERGDAGLSAKPVALRSHNALSVVLGRFRNEGFAQDVTLAQVFWFKEASGQPARLYVVADRILSIAEHFSGFGSNIADLRKRLRAIPGIELHETFPPYGAAFRRRFGIDNEQALELFNQTVSMKSVGNLTEFVRQHMLDAFPVETRIQALIGHFDDLTRAHEAVLKARAQIESLGPLVADCDQHAVLVTEVETLRRCRDALRGYFAGLKAGLLETRLTSLETELSKLDSWIAALKSQEQDQRARRDAIMQAIAANGGDQIDALRREIAAREIIRNERAAKARNYAELAAAAGLSPARDADTFLSNQRSLDAEIATVEKHDEALQQELTGLEATVRPLREQHAELSREIESLRQRRSNIPARILEIRARLCRDLGLDDRALPFAGELVEVRPDESAWEGAAERVLHSFALSLLVTDERYGPVAEWVDRAHLGERLVYFRVRERRQTASVVLHPCSLVRKLAIRPDSEFYAWLEADLAQRFDYACCDTLDQFRREERALTVAGQIKSRGERHEKDDRHRINDRTRYVLGWSNEAKIAALSAEVVALEDRIAATLAQVARARDKGRSLRDRFRTLEKLTVYESFRDLDWQSVAVEIEGLERERQELEAGSDILRTLSDQLRDLEALLRETDAARENAAGAYSKTEERLEAARNQLADCVAQRNAAEAEVVTELFPRLDAMRADALGEHRLTVETCDGRERDLREWLQVRIDNEDKRLARLREKIVRTMQDYRRDYPLETREVDAAVEAGPDYRSMLDELLSDGLPRFEARFKDLLNENTIREVANFQSQLARERQTIEERIATINKSLRDIDYNPGRFIVLEASESADSEIRDFRRDLKACTEGTLTGSQDSTYSEAKFLQVRQIIERFRGREGTGELDRRWTRKVTDVRNWFTFSASERWREDEREHEHYTDSGGKSGGQKEKLAYTVLAASLAYQFGLEWGATRSRSFRFVLIDEAFGRGSDESARYGLDLFCKLGLQLLVVTPLQKIHVIEPYVAAVGFVHSKDGNRSMLRNMTIEEYRAERQARAG
jgi:uncharacterized protein YPO0396